MSLNPAGMMRGRAPGMRSWQGDQLCAIRAPRYPHRSHVGPTQRAQVVREAAAGSTTVPSEEGIRIPQSLHDVDNGHILGFGADLAEDHPGFHDEEYKKRRMMIAHMAKAHEIGTPIPEVNYLPEETKTWGIALENLADQYPSLACREFNKCFPLFGFKPDDVPQLQDVSKILKSRTGWQIRPVAGLMHPRDFLNGLAFKTFHSTQYMRHHSQPMYTPEPDLVHELLGHVPMLADPAFCELIHAIGVASLGASEKNIWHLTRVYWYTVEFGVVWEDDKVKAFGAGILSSFGELEWMGKGLAKLGKLDPFKKLPAMDYKGGFQKQYFTLDTFEAGAAMLKAYADSIRVVECFNNAS